MLSWALQNELPLPMQDMSCEFTQVVLFLLSILFNFICMHCYCIECIIELEQNFAKPRWLP
jgi:hypothetical protein